ncbi:hypothetical protein BU24DRAFT_495201 [Aaosphaeria arxii CBS 175.79]|uniref:DUF7371 domain-containing protein n=1 Tax=Aaosphaeria arxii CBS 175.79 TaxID=1450172 RepID=A0A6A5XH15_9PLEO|nr:uncharacterized protein BU24DRAFT_495201 [Aaosphaeria arxii CBS 175.79]KAF2012127.1 hypothetical protein BU24DRAFT_495201 [Aaosphaeria arxii CBS 175.79]
MTQVVAYSEQSFTFIFPTPTVITTRSYWAGAFSATVRSKAGSSSMTTRMVRRSLLPGRPPSQSVQALSTTSTTDTAISTNVEATPTNRNVTRPEPTLCGEYGNFTLNFDDTTVRRGDNNTIVATGMINPYHHLFYSNGLTYIPDKWGAYRAVSQPNIAMFLPLNGKLLPDNAAAGTLLEGEIGAGPRASVNAYWFNARSGYFGCSLSGISPCALRISGYRFDPILQREVKVAEQNVTIPACWGFVGCQLTRVFFSDRFRGLSGIQFKAYTYNLGIPQVYMLDDLAMEWYNNSCAAGVMRLGNHFGPGANRLQLLDLDRDTTTRAVA